MSAHGKLHSITLMCRLFRVSPSGYYKWLNHQPSHRQRRNKRLDHQITTIYKEHRGRYGAPRITRELHRQGVDCSLHRIIRRMKCMNLKVKVKRKFKVTTDSKHNLPVAVNVLKRDFSTNHINQKILSDITYIRTDEGWLYLAAVLDLHSRSIIT
ncbi:IS3 family transposase [Piscirickettsia salmonis]|uniref:IS3 family transposase n=1 Tax=Piscirickettsia salmonis TaxID=1238 RepID=UPI001E47C50F|nr:IS3 family transposase [Piscirickettsia salmonis]